MQNHDPRPDLTTDSVAWSWLLRLAYPGMNAPDEGGLYTALVGLRTAGAALVVKDGRYRIAAGEMHETTYRHYRVKYLWAHTERIVELLARLKDVKPEERAEDEASLVRVGER